VARYRWFLASKPFPWRPLFRNAAPIPTAEGRGDARRTMAAWVGVTFQDGAMLGMLPAVLKASRITAGPWKLANLPHMDDGKDSCGILTQDPLTRVLGLADGRRLADRTAAARAVC